VPSEKIAVAVNWVTGSPTRTTGEIGVTLIEVMIALVTVKVVLAVSP